MKHFRFNVICFFNTIVTIRLSRRGRSRRDCRIRDSRNLVWSILFIQLVY